MKHTTPFAKPCSPSARRRGLKSVPALLVLGMPFFSPAMACAQISQPPRPLSGSHAFNAYQTVFQQAWSAVITDPVRLIEIGPVIEDKKNNLILLVGGQETNDYKRKLIVTHWDGSRFVTDSSNDFLGTALDALAAGHFRPVIKPVVQTTGQAAKPKKTKPVPATQIVTTEGVYMWNGSSFTRLFSSPPNLRLALILDGSPDQMVINNGESAAPYEAGETDSHPSAFMLQVNDAGYARLAVGTQTYEGAKDFTPNVRFAQSYWQGRSHWQIGLERGKPASLPNVPDATTGDRLVVYTPKMANREKPYWKMTRYEDFEESWKSAPLPGRVLDVRVGDPKSEGKDGILVLTAENNDKERHLYFFQPVTGRLPR